MKKIDGGSLQEIIAAEQQLKGREKDGSIEEMFPVGHPVRMAYERSKAIWERRQQFEEQQEDSRPLKRAKRIKKGNKKAPPKAVVDEIDNAKLSKARNTITHINAKIDTVSGLLEEIGREITSSSSDLEDFPTVRLRLVRLQRILVAVHRGLNESKVNTHRMR